MSSTGVERSIFMFPRLHKCIWSSMTQGASWQESVIYIEKNIHETSTGNGDPACW